MAGVPPNSLRQDELPEYPYVGPFGGLQSEVPLDKIGRSGFAEVQNVIFRKSAAVLVSAFLSLGAQPRSGITIGQLVGTIAALTGIIANLSSVAAAEVIVGIADFFNVNGTRVFLVMTPSRVYQWNGVTFTQITGSLTGNVNQFFQWDVVGYKLYFSQQQDKVKVWDGVTTSFADASASTVPAKYVCEFDTHLLIANTIEGGVVAPNRLRWSGAGDGTDWTSFSSGQIDIFNGLGPINGLGRLYQSAYAFQQWGITQINRTGIGTAPFALVPMGSRAKGSILPYGVATFGEVVSCYVGKNDVYIFDGTESIGIGSRPIDGNRRLGARGRIFNDLFTAQLSNIFGFINTSDSGVDYESYWLLIPSLNKAWVYHFDEGSWTQIYFNPGQLLGPVGIFAGNTGGSPTIAQLIGTIASQSWTFQSLTNASPLDTMAISDANAMTVSLLSPGTASSLATSGSIFPNDGWYIRSGQLTFDDPRHSHTVKKVRVCFIDYANVLIHLRLTNENGQTTGPQPIQYGNGSGQTITRVFDVSLPGKYITWELSGPKGVNWGMSEITPIYDTNGEIQSGVR